jgi:hypothetical protein
MKKWISVFSSLAVTAALGFSFLAGNVFAAESPTAKVKIVYVLEDQIPSNVKIDPADKKFLQENGWVFQGNTIKRYYFNKNMEITQKSVKKLTDSEGIFDVPLNQDEEDVDIQLTKNVNDKRKVHLKKGQTAIIEKKISFDTLISRMGGTSQPSSNLGTTSYDAGPPYDQRQYYGGEDVHCNRFNGYAGNGKYYKDHWSVQGLINFTQSDCDVSLGRGFLSNCWGEDLGLTDNRYCAWTPAYKRGECSLDVGHNWTYHKHTEYFGPSGY